MNPCSPVMPGLEPFETTLNGPNNEFVPLPCLRGPDGRVVSRWRPTPEELDMINAGGSIFLCIWSGENSYPPTSLYVSMAQEKEAEELRSNLHCDEFMEIRMMGEEIKRSMEFHHEIVARCNQRIAQIQQKLYPEAVSPDTNNGEQSNGRGHNPPSKP